MLDLRRIAVVAATLIFSLGANVAFAHSCNNAAYGDDQASEKCEGDCPEKDAATEKDTTVDSDSKYNDA